MWKELNWWWSGLLVVALAIAGVAWALGIRPSRSSPRPKPPPSLVEKAGHSAGKVVGRAGRGIGRGVFEGLRGY